MGYPSILLIVGPHCYTGKSLFDCRDTGQSVRSYSLEWLRGPILPVFCQINRSQIWIPLRSVCSLIRFVRLVSFVRPGSSFVLELDNQVQDPPTGSKLVCGFSCDRTFLSVWFGWLRHIQQLFGERHSAWSVRCVDPVPGTPAEFSLTSTCDWLAFSLRGILCWAYVFDLAQESSRATVWQGLSVLWSAALCSVRATYSQRVIQLSGSSVRLV